MLFLPVVAVSIASLGQSASVIFSTFLMEVLSPVFLGWSLCTASYSHLINCGSSVEYKKTQAAALGNFFFCYKNLHFLIF